MRVHDKLQSAVAVRRQAGRAKRGACYTVTPPFVEHPMVTPSGAGFRTPQLSECTGCAAGYLGTHGNC